MLYLLILISSVQYEFEDLYFQSLSLINLVINVNITFALKS